ncbi:hypothetical protein PFISCL1PPCAC_20626, partial [Pristionchus fissidentatus]
ERNKLNDQVFCIGTSACSLALFSILKTKAMHNSFGAICASQMIADILKLCITTFFCLLPIEFAPPEDEWSCRIMAACCECLYFFACDLHTLFAVHRFILVVFPSKKKSWSRLTPIAITFCFCTGFFKAFYLMLLDENLYLRYNRRRMLWMWTDTPWTEFYRDSKIIWSSVENSLIIFLDTISYTKLRAMLRKARETVSLKTFYGYTLSDFGHFRDSLCQCIPTTLVIIFYFYVYPAMTKEFLIFASSTLMWNTATMCDGIIVVFFHTRPYLFRGVGYTVSI